MTRRKGKRHILKMYGVKSQRLTHQIEISKISAIDLKKRCKDQNDQKKRSQMKNFYFNVIKFMWEVIYVYFYNSDKSLYLVLVMYDLVELIIKILH